MCYTNAILFLLGMLGILLHCLVELNKINKANADNLRCKIGKYFRLEFFSILISVVVVVVCIIAKHEITQLEKVGQWLGLAFMAIGYMGQSILVALMGKAQKTIDKAKE